MWPVIGGKGYQILAFNAGDKARLVTAKLENKGENLRILFPALILRPGDRYIMKRPSRMAQGSGEAILGKVLFDCSCTLEVKPVRLDESWDLSPAKLRHLGKQKREVAKWDYMLACL